MEFEDEVEAALETLPEDLREAMSNVAIVVEDEPPAGQPLLGLYEGIPLTKRSSFYAKLDPVDYAGDTTAGQSAAAYFFTNGAGLSKMAHNPS